MPVRFDQVKASKAPVGGLDVCAIGLDGGLAGGITWPDLRHGLAAGMILWDNGVTRLP